MTNTSAVIIHALMEMSQSLAEIILANIKLFLHFLSFLNIKTNMA